MVSKVQSIRGSRRPTRAEVDVGAIAHNLGVIRDRTAAKVLAVVKADAYGHGAVPVARALEAAGADGFAVALVEEGLELREAGIVAPILVMSGRYADADASAEVVARRLTPVVFDVEQIAAFGPPEAVGVHLKVDTGMSRLGVSLREIPEALDRAKGRVTLDGLMTHFASADSDDAFTDHQLAEFTKARAALAARGHRPEMVHAANTAATLRRSDSHFDAVRVGLALYGYCGFSMTGPAPGLKSAMRLRTEILAIRDLAVGAVVGYGSTFRAERPTRVATLPIGYADGVHWSSGNKGQAIVAGARCPILGRVSMDLTVIDVTEVAAAAVGSEVVLLGPELGADEVAEAAGTIPYEILTGISRRVPRSYGPTL